MPQGATITVTSAADSGPGTLRQALLDAQDGDTIAFAPSVFPPTAPVTISITSELPGLVSNLTIDASSAGVILDGSNLAGGWRAGLQIVGSDGTIIRGLQISNFSGPHSIHNNITQNSIHDNGWMGIELADGANLKLAIPGILDFDLPAGTVTGATCANCTVEIFSDASDEGAIYEGQTTADGSGIFPFDKGTSFNGPHLTATSTDMDGNTSPFSAPTTGTARSVTFSCPPCSRPTLVSGLGDTYLAGVSHEHGSGIMRS